MGCGNRTGDWIALSVLGQRRRKQRVSLNNDPGVASRAIVLIVRAHPSNRFRRGLVAMHTRNFGNLIVEKVSSRCFGRVPPNEKSWSRDESQAFILGKRPIL